MSKSPDAFRTISEVAELLDVPAHVLRFWETRFAQVKPVKRGGGRRYYRPDDVRLLRGIRGLLYDDGMTIKGVQKILREQGVRHVIGLGTVDDAAPAPAPAPRRAAPKAPPRPAARPAPAPQPVLAGAEARPQGDLFADGSAEGEAAVGLVANPAGNGADPGEPARPVDRSALRRLVGELEALRAVMVGQPRA